MDKSPQLARLIHTARKVNDRKPEWVFEKVKHTLADCVVATNSKASELTIACLGLAFKADIDDFRESPALQITQQIADWHSGKVLAVEPHIQHLLLENVQLVDLNTALNQADILVLLVDHISFRNVPVTKIQQSYIVDCRGVWK